MSATLDEWQIALLRRVRHADHLSPSEQHDFATLMGDDLHGLPDHWLAETYQTYEVLGLLDKASGTTFGAYHGRLSPQARWFLDDLEDDAA